MKFLASILFILFFSACSHQNGFSKFDLTLDQEKAIDSLQSGKIYDRKDAAGIFAAIHLNEVYPQEFYKQETFLVYFYLKEDATALSANCFYLNKQAPLEIETLPPLNRFSHLSGVENEWNQYFVISFALQQEDKMLLKLEDERFSSSTLLFRKNEE